MFSKRCAELGEPNKSVFVAKLARPTFSCGILKKIIIIKKIHTKNPNSFNILFLIKKMLICKLFLIFIIRLI
jgi:hypothetical protein